jgi:hypothetical protein
VSHPVSLTKYAPESVLDLFASYPIEWGVQLILHAPFCPRKLVKTLELESSQQSDVKVELRDQSETRDLYETLPPYA